MTARLGIELQDVDVRRGAQWVLRGLTLRLNPGERWALLGGNGAGKTQFLKLLAADVWPTPTGREVLTYRLGRRRLELRDAKPRIAYVGAELQDKYARYGWNLSLADLLATGLHRSDLLLQPVTKAQRMRVERMLAAAGLAALRARRFLSLSYGQKRLALLARALVQQPEWLLLDELYNGLDLTYRRRVDRLLARFSATGRSWVAAAHRAMDVPQGTGGVLELRAGRLLAPRVLGREELGRLTRQAAESDSVGPAAARSPPRRTSRRTPRRAAARQPLVRIVAADLYVDYRPVLRGLNWELHRGEHWAVFGANGAGKSSFLRLLYGDLSPAQGGRIERAGLPRGAPIAQWKQRVGFVSPELQTDYLIDVTLADLVGSGRHASIGLNEAPGAAARRHALRWLAFVGLEDVAQRRPREVSYGQLRRALLARALASNPRILLLDEPLTGLDPTQRAFMKRVLQRLMRRDVVLVMAVHHAEDVPHGVTHALRLHKRRAHAEDFRFAT